MKLLEVNEEIVGKLFWVQRQYLETNGGWRVLPIGEKVLSLVTPEFKIEPVEEKWPTIPGDCEGEVSILKEWGYESEHKGNSGFEVRNYFIVRKINPVTDEFIAPLLVVGALRGRQKEAVGLTKKLFFHDQFILDLEENYFGQVPATFEMIEAHLKVDEAKKEWQRRKQAYFANKFFQASKDFGLTAVMDLGGHEEFEFTDIPEHYFELGKRCILYTQDHRCKLTHTYRVVLLNTARIQDKHAVNLKIPEEMKGIVIGKDGLNIKSSAERLGKKLYVI
ncbi:MAG: KH domain-containing protein [Patescibacteria group bacterium]